MLRQALSSVGASLRVQSGVAGAVRTGWRCMSDESHDDFKPEVKYTPAKTIMEQIDHEVKSNKVMVYMKGTPAQPMCGFSARVVALLKAYGVPFEYQNVLDSDELRQAIKQYRQWPTIPQVFVNGELVGGCDVLWEEHEQGKFLDVMDAK